MINSTFMTRYRWNPIKHTAQFFSDVCYCWIDTFYMNTAYCNLTHVMLKYKDTWCEPELNDN